MTSKELLIILGTMVIIGIFSSCEKDVHNSSTIKTDNSNKQIVLTLECDVNTTSVDGVIELVMTKFDKRNYSGLNSIVFSSNPYSADINSKSIVELYNISDNMPINNTAIKSSQAEHEINYLETDNVYNDFPNKEIDLGIRIRSEKGGVLSGLRYNSYLTLDLN